MPKYTPKIEGIPVISSTIVQAIEYAYPGTLTTIQNKKLYGYLTLFGIRVNTCDTGQPDDFVGGLRLMPSATGDYWQIELSEASVDPSPKYMKTIYDAEAKAKGGTAWFKEGKYSYALTSKGGYPAFRPTKKIPVWRWNQKINGEYFSQFAYAGNGGGVLLQNGVEVETGNMAIQSDVTDTMIHRSWSRITRDNNGNIIRGKFTNDSAGCQVFENNQGLITIDGWAKKHLKTQGYPNVFMYCLINKRQFYAANENGYIKKENAIEQLRQSRENFLNLFQWNGGSW
jgi:hypothetical protein